MSTEQIFQLEDPLYEDNREYRDYDLLTLTKNTALTLFHTFNHPVLIDSLVHTSNVDDKFKQICQSYPILLYKQDSNTCFVFAYNPLNYTGAWFVFNEIQERHGYNVSRELFLEILKSEQENLPDYTLYKWVVQIVDQKLAPVKTKADAYQLLTEQDVRGTDDNGDELEPNAPKKEFKI